METKRIRVIAISPKKTLFFCNRSYHTKNKVIEKKKKKKNVLQMKLIF